MMEWQSAPSTPTDTPLARSRRRQHRLAALRDRLPARPEGRAARWLAALLDRAGRAEVARERALVAGLLAEIGVADGR